MKKKEQKKNFEQKEWAFYFRFDALGNRKLATLNRDREFKSDRNEKCLILIE